MAGSRLRKGDRVKVMRGNERGKEGTILRVDREKNRVVVEGVNYVTRHSRVGQTQRGTKTGGIETVEAPIHISNVALVDPSTKKPTRVGHRVEEQTKDGVKRTVRVRFAKKSGKDL